MSGTPIGILNWGVRPKTAGVGRPIAWQTRSSLVRDTSISRHARLRNGACVRKEVMASRLTTAAVVVLLFSPGCARQAGSRAAQGAITTLQEERTRAQLEQADQAPIMRRAAAGAVRGALSELSL